MRAVINLARASSAALALALLLPVGVAGQAARTAGNAPRTPWGHPDLQGLWNVGTTYFYNNLKQIVQTKDSVMILTEMVHDARIIPFKTTHAPPAIRKWMGDSIARWDGDTLVVESTNFNDKTRFRGSSETLKVTERFNRLPDHTILYRFTIDDPTTWPRPWTGEYTWAAAKPDDQLYEYACHEGNYAMEGIMKGARLLEAEAAEAAKTVGSRP